MGCEGIVSKRSARSTGPADAETGEDEEPGFQESVIPSVGKRTAREAHRRYRQRRRRFDPELPFKIGPMNGR